MVCPRDSSLASDAPACSKKLAMQHAFALRPTRSARSSRRDAGRWSSPSTTTIARKPIAGSGSRRRRTETRGFARKRSNGSTSNASRSSPCRDAPSPCRMVQRLCRGRRRPEDSVRSSRPATSCRRWSPTQCPRGLTRPCWTSKGDFCSGLHRKRVRPPSAWAAPPVCPGPCTCRRRQVPPPRPGHHGDSSSCLSARWSRS